MLFIIRYDSCKFGIPIFHYVSTGFLVDNVLLLSDCIEA